MLLNNNVVGTGIAKAGEEFVHLANILLITTGQALGNAFTVQALLFLHRNRQRIPSRVFKRTEEALKQYSLLFALEKKAIIKASPTDALGLRR